MTEPGDPVFLPISRSIGAIAMGASLALVGFVAGFAQGMSAAPSSAGGIVALAIVAVGAALGLLGLVSIWMPRLRLAASGGTIAVGVLLVVAFVIHRVLLALAII